MGGALILEELKDRTLLGSTVALNEEPADIFWPKMSQVREDFNATPVILVQVVEE